MVVQVCILLNSFIVLDVVHSLRGPDRRGIFQMCTNDEIDCSLRDYTALIGQFYFSLATG